MDVADLLADLTARGVVLRPERSGLAAHAPRGVLTPALRALLAQHKQELLALLSDADRAPLSPAQERLWFLDQLSPGSSAYNVCVTLRLRGALDIAALERSLTEILRRHDALRATFQVVADRPVQVIAPPVPFALPCVDRRGSGGADDEARRLTDLEAARPFDLARGPLFRAALWQLGGADHLLAITAPHIVIDGVSALVILEEVGVLYRAFVEGRPSPLPPPPLRYADYARAQRARPDTEIEGLVHRCVQRLAGAPPALDLPADRPRSAIRSGRGARCSLELPEALGEALLARSRAEGVTLFMTLLSAFATLLHRLTGEIDLVVGTPVAGRDAAEVERLIGLFVNPLAIRINLAGDPPFRELLGRVRAAALEAYAHADVPFERLVAALNPGRRLGRTPLFQVMLNLVNLGEEQLTLPGLDVEFAPTLPGSRLDLTVYVFQRGSRFRLEAAYDIDLFDAERMSELVAQLASLLAQIAKDPSPRVGSFSLVTRGAEARLPRPADPLPRGWEGAAHERFALEARREPDRVAVVDRDGAWTYGQIDAASNGIANHLVENGVRREDRVAVYAHRSAALVPALLGVLRAGAAFVILDPAHPAPRQIECLRAAAPAAWIQMDTAPAPPRELVEHVASERLALRMSLSNRELMDWMRASAEPPGVEVAPDDLAYVAFTSGTTGRPRGVAGTHRPLSHFIAWHARTFRLTGADRFAMLSGLSHDPLLRDLFTPLWLGATLCVPEWGDREELGQLAGWAQREAITVAHLTPALGRVLAAAPRAALRSLRYAFFGGDALTFRDVEAFRAVAPSATCVNFYGATETPQAMSYLVVPDRLGCASTGAGPSRVPIGAGIDGAELLVLNGAGELAGVGELGEIHIRSPYLARGYVHDDEATRQKFIPNPFVAGAPAHDRLYRSGDLGRYLPDGAVELAGRADRQLKLRGHRVEPAEIEAALASHPTVREALVVAASDDAGEPRLLAYIVGRAGAPAAAEELRVFARARLPDFMVPSAITALAALPLTPHGKVDLAALPDPDQVGPATDDRAAPRTPVEEVMAGLWAGVLHREAFGIHDSFFDLGGHSLLAIRLLARIRDAFGVEVPVRGLFEAPTVAGLAACVEGALSRAAPGKGPALAPIPRDGPLALSFAQQRLWFLDRLDPEGPGYRVAQALRLRGELDVDALDRGLAEIERRHEVLRTTFSSDDGRPFPVIHAGRPRMLEILDLQRLPAAERDAETLRWHAAEHRRPFDLKAGPMWRATLLRLGPEEHVLGITMHHIVSDGGSAGVLRAELLALYEAYSRGAPPPLPPLPLQYVDYAAWQRRRLAEGVLSAQLAYWKDRLAGLSTLDLPTSRLRPPARALKGSARSREVPRPLVDALRALGRREGVTLFMTLLAAFDLVLFRYTGQTDIPVGTPVGDRPETSLEGLIGLFVNIVVLRADLSGDPSVRALLRRVREVAIGAYANRDAPFEQVVESVSLDRDRSRTPLFQVYFNMLDVGAGRLTLPGVTVEELDRRNVVARFDWMLYALERSGDLELVLVHDVDLFEQLQADTLLDHLLEALQGMASDPDRPISTLRLSRPEKFTGRRGDGEMRQYDSSPRLPASLCKYHEESIPRCFEEVARRLPDKIAIRADAGDVTYGELDALADRAAAWTASVSPAPQLQTPRVALLFTHDAAMVAGVLGALKAGAAYVPLDPAEPDVRLAEILDDADVSAVLTRGAGVARAAALSSGRLPVLDMDALPACAPTRVLAGPDSLAYILYTSGSTGRPKGVMQSHRNVLGHIGTYINRLQLGEDDRVSLLSKYTFDAAVMDLFGALLSGATLCLIDAAGDGLSRLPQRLASAGVTVYHSTPTLYRELVARLGRGEVLRDVRRVVLGGEEARRSDVEAFRRCFPPDCVLVNGLGPTECTLALQWFMDREAPIVGESVPVGYPTPDVEVALVNAAGEQVAAYGTGEIILRSPHLALGYWRRPELTEAAFSTDPAGGSRRTYRTGDRGRLLPDGAIAFAGRMDAQIKIRGHRVEPGEIEARLRECPGVAEVVVLAREQAAGELRVEAFFVPAAGESPEPRELRRSLRARLPDWMIPSSFRAVEALPQTPTRKIDRRALLALAPEDMDHEGSKVLPRDALEVELAGIWESVLEVRPIGVHEGFFDLGGHSLLAVRLMDRIEERFSRRIPLAVLFEGVTIARLAEVLRGDAARSCTGGPELLLRLRSSGAKTPFACVAPPGSAAALHFSALARHLDPERPLFALQPPASTTIEDVASRCCAALRQVCPEGPYLLGGFSNGGVVAFEMAQQLAQRGEVVSALALLDARAPGPARAPGADGAALLLAGFAAHLARRPGDVGLRIPPERLRALDLRQQLTLILQEAKTARVVRHDTTLGELWDAFERYRDQRVQSADLVRRYIPRMYPGPVTLYRASGRSMEACQGDPTLGWGRLTTSALEIQLLPGDHETMLAPPHVRIAAEALGQRLDGANGV